MTHLLQILYALSGIVALSAGGFQLAKLLKHKNSDDFNFGTWLMWAITQTITTTYAIVVVGDPLYIGVSGGWAAFYIVMSVLIVHYSSSPAALFTTRPRPVPVEVTHVAAPPHDSLL